MSMTQKQYEERATKEQMRRLMMTRMNATRELTRSCKTDDEKYARIMASVEHDMIWRMTHVPGQN